MFEPVKLVLTAQLGSGSSKDPEPIQKLSTVGSNHQNSRGQLPGLTVLQPTAVVQGFTALAQSPCSEDSLVQAAGSVVSLVQYTGLVQETGGVAADQNRHRGGGLGFQGEVGGPHGVI